MPTRPPHVCSGCGATVTGACSSCSSGWTRRPSSSWRGGSTRRWRRFRAAWLADNPMCVGYTGPCGAVAEHVDHITPLSQFLAGTPREAARFDPRNVQSLCVPCHTRKTNDEAQAARRIRRAQDRTGQLW